MKTDRLIRIDKSIRRAVICTAVLLTAAGMAVICSQAETAETDENGNPIVYASLLRPSYSEKPYLVVDSENNQSYITRAEIKEEAIAAAAAAKDAVNYSVVPLESSEMTMTAGLAVYLTPVTSPTYSAGSWEQSEGGEDGELSWRFTGTDGLSYASGGWLYICDEYSYLSREGGWYYFDENGYLTGGWTGNGTDWHFTNTEHDGTYGLMATGWHKDSDGYTYYLDKQTGQMLTGWQEIDDIRYYFAEDAENGADPGSGGSEHPYGSMYRSEQTPDGTYTDSTGKAIRE